MITPMEKVVYTAHAHTVGGRDGGSSRTSDGELDVKLALPGSHAHGTNPEQLFAVGWSSCFLSAIKLVAARNRVRLSPDVSVDAEVDLGVTEGGYLIRARLMVSLPAVSREMAMTLIEGAHLECPYSKATYGNIDVVTTLVEPMAANLPSGAILESVNVQ